LVFWLYKTTTEWEYDFEENEKMIVCTFHDVYHTLLYQPRMGVGVVFRSGNFVVFGWFPPAYSNMEYVLYLTSAPAQ
jgi:hypothetical protein